MLKNWRFWTGVGVGVIVVLLAVSMIGMALAQGPEPGWQPFGHGRGFVDEDGDGIPDNCPSDGVCDGHPFGHGHGFVDEDGDGVCDGRPFGRGHCKGNLRGSE
jgi:hypothetical protein